MTDLISDSVHGNQPVNQREPGATLFGLQSFSSSPPRLKFFTSRFTKTLQLLAAVLQLMQSSHVHTDCYAMISIVKMHFKLLFGETNLFKVRILFVND